MLEREIREEEKKRIDVEIAPLVQKASDEEKGDVAHKKLARDQVRRVEYAKRLPPVFRIIDPCDFAAVDLLLTLAPGRDLYFELVSAHCRKELLNGSASARRNLVV